MESSFDCYTPLERPGISNRVAEVVDHELLEDGECETDKSSSQSDGDSSDGDRLKRTILNPRRKRVPDQPLSIPNKYDIWSSKLREDSLTETMRNFGVNRQEGDNNRNVEWYDFTVKNRFAKDGTNRLKRRRSNGSRETDERDEDDSNDHTDVGSKRFCSNRRGSKSPQNPRHLGNLELHENHTCEDMAKEVANKLNEKNDVLIHQITKTLGEAFVQKTYEETRKIESEGGMMIMNGRRRRTSGGVFIFLVKHSDIPEEKKKEAFTLDSEKCTESSRRDEEIEELKKTLITNDKGSPTLRPKELLNHQDTSTTLSNPPPSPVAASQEEDIFNNNSDMDFN